MTVTVQHGKPADVILQHSTSSTTGSPAIDRARRAQSPWTSAIHGAVRCARSRAPDRPSDSRRVRAQRCAGSGVNVPFRRILCAIDFSPASMSALDEAVRILRQDGGTMRLLHVVDIVRPAVPRIALEFPTIDYTQPLTRHTRAGASGRCCRCRKSSMDGCTRGSMSARRRPDRAERQRIESRPRRARRQETRPTCQTVGFNDRMRSPSRRVPGAGGPSATERAACRRRTPEYRRLRNSPRSAHSVAYRPALFPPKEAGDCCRRPPSR